MVVQYVLNFLLSQQPEPCAVDRSLLDLGDTDLSQVLFQHRQLNVRLLEESVGLEPSFNASLIVTKEKNVSDLCQGPSGRVVIDELKQVGSVEVCPLVEGLGEDVKAGVLLKFGYMKFVDGI